MAGKPLGVGVIGFGTVGIGVVRLLQDMPFSMRRRKDASFFLAKIAVRDVSKERDLDIEQTLITEDVFDLLNDPKVEVIVEVTGAPAAYEWVRHALEIGKDVVTANKALLAECGDELYSIAAENGSDLLFEASVAGGIPIIRSMRSGLVANNIESIRGILNGTTNYILTRMTRGEGTYEEILADAQEIGFAEPDPTMDVSGRDAAQKLAILSRIAFCSNAVGAEVFCEGIEDIETVDISYAQELGYVIKLLAIAKIGENGVEMRVHPAMVPEDSLLGNINDEFNAVEVIGSSVGNQVFYGKGAGQMPTASAIVSDILDVVERRNSGAKPIVSDMLLHDDAVPMASMGAVKMRFFLRMQVTDQPGVLEQIARILSVKGISIASVLQKERHTNGGFVPLVIVTHEANGEAMRDAVNEINSLEIVHDGVRFVRIEELK